MKKIVFAAAALAAMGLAGTASAASYGPQVQHVSYAPQGINQIEADIARRIEQGVRQRMITQREARYLRGELRQIERLEANYRRGGLSRWERNDLERRLDVLSQKVRFERHDRDFRGDGRFDRQGPSRW